MNLNFQLARLETAQLVRRVGEEEATYIFKHALTQDAAYQSLLQKQRREIHHHVARAIEQIYVGQLDEFAVPLTQHYAVSGDDTKTVEYAIRAGDSANRVNAHTEARLHYAQALTTLERLPDNAENRRRRMQTLAKRVSVSFFADAPTLNLARLDEAEALAKQLAECDPTIQGQLAQIYGMKGFVNQMRNDPQEALRAYNQARALAQTLGDEPLLTNATFQVGLVLSVQGRLSDAEPVLRDSIERMRKAGMLLEGIWALTNLARVRAGQGFYAEGLAEAQRGMMLAQQANHSGAVEVAHATLAELYHLGRDFPRMLQASQAILESAEASHDLIFLYLGSVYVAWAQSCLGHHQAARENLAKAKTFSQQFGGRAGAEDLAAAAEAEIALNAAHWEEAQALAEQAVNLARAVDSIYSEALAQRVWGQALIAQKPPGFDEAEAHLATSLHLFEAGDARLEEARTHFVWGKLLIERNDREKARSHLEQAAAQFEKSGLMRELEETRALMRERQVEN